MTEWVPTPHDVKVAYANFRGPWDFATQGPLKLALREPQKPGVYVMDGAALQPMKLWHAVYTLEDGRVDHKPAWRIVGKVPDLDFEVVLETRVTR